MFTDRFCGLKGGIPYASEEEGREKARQEKGR
jgi:hypothetical protein